MDPGDACKEIEESICWANAPPAPLPDMCYIEPEIRRDFTAFDGSLEDVIPRRLHTGLVDALDIDFMGMAMRHIDGGCGGQDPGLSGPCDEFPKDPERRSTEMERERVKKAMSKIFDYQKYIQESFEDVESPVHPLDKSIGVLEAYSLFPETSEDRAIVQSDGFALQEGLFSIEEDGDSKLFARASMPDGSVLTCLPQRVDDFLVIHVRDGNAYYSEVSTLYRLREHRNQRAQARGKQATAGPEDP